MFSVTFVRWSHALRRHELDELLNLGANGIGQLLARQLEALHAD